MAQQFFPELRQWINIDLSWPSLIILGAVLLLVFGLLVGAPGLAVPAAIIGGIGGLLYWQNATGNWDSWAYAWTLIPGFVGVGIILQGLLSGNIRKGLNGGGFLVLLSLGMFAVMVYGLGYSQLAGVLWPVLLIAFGVWLLVRGLLR